MSESVNYYEKYSGVYTTSTNNETIIPITLDNTTYRNNLDILDVYINGMKLNKNEFSISGNNIQLVKALDIIGTKVEFEALRSILATNINYENLKGDTGSATKIKRWGSD